MGISMTAVLDVTAGNPTAGAAAAGSTSEAAEQTGGQSMFGKLLTGLAATTGQNAAVVPAGQTVDMQLLEKLSQTAESSMSMGQAAIVDQKGLTISKAMENGVKIAIPDMGVLTSPEGSELKPQLDIQPALTSATPKTAVEQSKEEASADKKEDSADEVLGMVNADVSVMLQMLRQPVLTAADRTMKQGPAAVAATKSQAEAMPLVASGRSDLQHAAPLPVAPAVAGEQPQTAAQPLQPAAPLDVAAVKANNQPEAAIKQPVTTPVETKQSERAAFRQKMAEQGVSVETVSDEKSVAKPAKIDLGFAEVVIRESSEAGAAGKEAAPVTPAEQGKMHQTNPLMAHTLETPDPTKQVQATAEPAKAANHEQIVSQVREKLSAVDMGRDGGQVVLRLHPEELGELKINVRMDNQRLRVDIITESPTVKEALLNNMNSLREVLSKQNIVMERFDVSTGGNNFQQAMRDGRAWEQQAGANPKPANRWATPGEVDDSLVATTTQYGRNRDYSMVDVRF